MARVNDTLYLTIGSDKQGGMVLTVYRVVAGGHMAVNELRGNDALQAYQFITKGKSIMKSNRPREVILNGD